MSFACGGWLQFYMFGVAKALQEYGLDKGVKYLGCSAGALTAAGIAFDGNFDDAIRFCKEYCLPKAYGDITGLFRLSDYVSMCIELCLLPNFRNLPKESLQIAVTRLPFFRSERVMVTDDPEECVLALLASSAAFPFAPLVNMKNGWFIDGGLSDFQPVLDKRTITVSPLYFSNSDIKPSRYVPLWWTFMPPSSCETVDWIYNLGFDDCVAFLKSKGIPLKSTGRYKKTDVEHPYNDPRRVRFIGYDMAKVQNRYLGFMMDVFLLLVLVFFWKPLALALIYVELWCRLSILAFRSFMVAFWEFFPPFLIQDMIQKAFIMIIPDILGLSHNKKHPARTIKKRRCKLLRELWECFTCLGSLSLFLRFISGPPSVAELRKHQRLAKYSVLYRVFRYII
eukprot:scaffold1507_cov158-Ochromonas_danica.AAC.21